MMALTYAVLATVVVVLVGAQVRRAGWRDRWVILALGLGTVVVGHLVASGRDPEVSSSDVAWGTLLGAIGGFAAPLALYYALGRFVANPVAVGLAWAVSLVPVGYYLFFAWIITAGFVSCPPDAYECPL